MERLDTTLALGLLALFACAAEPRPPQPTPPYVAPWMMPPPMQPVAAAPAAPAPVPAAAPLAAAVRRAAAFHVELSVSGAAQADERLLLELRDAAGGTAWRCERKAPLAAGDLRAACPFQEPLRAGSYTVEASFRSAGASPASSLRQSFPITLEELAFEVMVSLEGAPLRLEELAVRRVLSAHGEVELHRQWSAARLDLPLRYTLANGSRGHTLQLEGLQGIAIAHLERRTRDGGWVPHARGLLCRAPHETMALPPGASALAEEGHHVGALRPLEEGSYRFRLRYALAPPAAAGAAPRARLQEVYEIADELRIRNDRLEPIEDIRNPFACDPPYRVDAEGVRHVKPECLGY